MSSPAQVSGPGRFSARTDTGGQPIRSLPDPDYGEATEFRDIQKAAPLAETNSLPPAPYPSDIAATSAAPTEAEPNALPPLPGLFDPGDPGIPMTSGVPVGPGSNAIPGRPRAASLREALEPFFASDPTGILAPYANHLAERGMW